MIITRQGYGERFYSSLRGAVKRKMKIITGIQRRQSRIREGKQSLLSPYLLCVLRASAVKFFTVP